MRRSVARSGGTTRTPAHGRTLVVIGVLALAVAACGGTRELGRPTIEGGAGAPDAVDCRPALAPDDPHPVRDGDHGQHPDLADIGSTLEPLVAALDGSYRDVGGGVWLDQEAGEVVVMLTDPAALPELRDLVADPDLLACMDATYTQAELEALQQAATDALTGPGTSGIDTVANRVEVEVEEDPAAVRDRLAAKVGEDALAAVSIVLPACAEVDPVPADGAALPGGASTCTGMMALATGTLVGDGACVWLGLDDGEEVGLVWPRGWWMDADGVVHDHHGTPRAAVGDDVEVGGGFGPATGDGCGPDAEGRWVVASVTTAGR